MRSAEKELATLKAAGLSLSPPPEGIDADLMTLLGRVQNLVTLGRALYARAVAAGATGPARSQVEAEMHAFGYKLFSSSVTGYFREVEPNTDGKKSRDILADFHKKYTEDLHGMRHECIFVGGPHPCANRMDGLHVGELRSGITAHIEKATLMAAAAVTHYGKELYTGAAKYTGLQGAGNPMTCMKERIKQASMKTHPCRNNKKLTCMQQADGHSWVKFMDMPELGDCLPPSYAQAWRHSHAQLIFIIDVMSADAPHW